MPTVCFEMEMTLLVFQPRRGRARPCRPRQSGISLGGGQFTAVPMVGQVYFLVSEMQGVASALRVSSRSSPGSRPEEATGRIER